MTEQKENWGLHCFGDLPLGAVFWVGEYEFIKEDDDHAEFSGELHEFSLEDEVGVLIIG